jgi:hypothetical protein
MASLSIRGLDERSKKRLRLAAARHGLSMFDPIGGVELKPLPGGPLSDIPRLDDENAS